MADVCENSVCARCSTGFLSTDKSIACEGGCSKLFHTVCVAIDELEFEVYARAKSKFKWFCSLCCAKFLAMGRGVSTEAASILNVVVEQIRQVSDCNRIIMSKLEELQKENREIRTLLPDKAKDCLRHKDKDNHVMCPGYLYGLMLSHLWATIFRQWNKLFLKKKIRRQTRKLKTTVAGRWAILHNNE